MTWKCPECGSKMLVVMITTAAKLTQSDDENFETEVEGDHEWDGDSLMTCQECAHCSASRQIEVED